MTEKYSFAGSERLQLFFDTPNQFAAALCCAIFLVLGLGAFAVQAGSERRLRAYSWAGYAIIAVALAGAPLLALTYSRGGYLAFAACCAAALLPKPSRIAGAAVLAVFLASLALVPSGLQRAGAAVPSDDDASVANRLELWEGTLAMIADHWQRGVGGESAFLETYSMWYQEPGRATRYGNAVNQYLDIAATQGLPMLFAYLLAASILLALPLWAFARTRQSGYVFLALVPMSFLVSSCFSAFLFHEQLRWTILALVGVATAISLPATRMWRSGKAAAALGGSAVAASAAVCLALAFAGQQIASGMAHEIADAREFGIEASLETVACKPRGMAPTGTAIFVSRQPDKIMTASRTLRTLSEMGYLALAPEIRNRGLDGLDQLREYLESIARAEALPRDEIVLVGHGAGARLAIVAAASTPSLELDRLVSIGARFEWPFEKLSPMPYLRELRCPITIAHGELDATAPVADARQLHRAAQEASLDSTLMIVEGQHHHLGARWADSLARALQNEADHGLAEVTEMAGFRERP